MAEQFIWGALQRAVNDPTTIDEAIAASVAAHNNEAESHLGTEQSLEIHRENPIVDHPAESVVNDKIQAGARRWVAIVDPNSESDFDTIQGAVDYASHLSPGDILIKSGTHYVNDNLVLPPTLSLYGEGFLESNVVFDVGASEAITYVRIVNFRLAVYTGAVAVNGTNIVNFSSITNVDGNDLVGAMFRVFDGGSLVLRRVVAILSPTSVSVAGAVLTTGTGYSSSFRPGFQFVNGSNEVNCYSSLSDIYDQLFVGFIGTVYTTGAVFAELGQLLKISSTGVLVFDNVFSGTSQDALLDLNAVSGVTAEINGLSFDGGGASAILYDDYETAYYKISNCHFFNSEVPLHLAGIPDNYLSTVDNCIISLDSSTAYIYCYYTNFSYCEFVRTTTNSAALVNGFVGLFDRCWFRASGGFSINAFPGSSDAICYRNCLIEDQRSFVLQGGSAGSEGDGIRVESCDIRMNSSQTLGLNNRGNYFVGNRVRGTTGTFTLASGSRYNFVTNNLSDGSFTNSGSNNIMDNNLSY